MGVLDNVSHLSNARTLLKHCLHRALTYVSCSMALECGLRVVNPQFNTKLIRLIESSAHKKLKLIYLKILINIITILILILTIIN